MCEGWRIPDLSGPVCWCWSALIVNNFFSFFSHWDFLSCSRVSRSWGSQHPAKWGLERCAWVRAAAGTSLCLWSFLLSLHTVKKDLIPFNYTLGSWRQLGFSLPLDISHLLEFLNNQWASSGLAWRVLVQQNGSVFHCRCWSSYFSAWFTVFPLKGNPHCFSGGVWQGTALGQVSQALLVKSFGNSWAVLLLRKA